MSRKTAKASAAKKDVPELNTRKIVMLCAGLFCLCSLIVGAIYLDYNRFVSGDVLHDGQEETVVIAYGASWDDILFELRDERIVSRRYYFDFWARDAGLPRAIKAGTYHFKGPLTLVELDQKLRQGGEVDDVRVTIPEGFTIFHIADRLEMLGVVSKRDFLDAARSKELLKKHDVQGESFEGYLFPDTYAIKKGSSAEAIVERFHARWDEVIQEVIESNPGMLEEHQDAREMDLHDLVILASLVERETNHNPERALISRVFLNRIDKGMKLQTDPTCVYGEETYMEVPSPKRCRDRLNRYSTYVIKGLPPGPISNPGRRSLEAALNPDKSAEARKYLFFVARRDGSGSHYFTSTYKEHVKAIDKFLR